MEPPIRMAPAKTAVMPAAVEWMGSSFMNGSHARAPLQSRQGMKTQKTNA